MPSWEAFLARYRPMARAIALNLTGNRAEADDLVSEALLALYEKWGQGGSEPGSTIEDARHARNYLFRSVRNLAAKSHRRPSTRALPEELADPRQRTKEEESSARRRELLVRELASLPPAERELLTARFLRGETLLEMSRKSGVPLSTLHSRERALIARLRQQLLRRERGSREGDET